MKQKILLSALAILGAITSSGSATAQNSANAELTSEVKQQVLASMERRITQNAFVPGVDFSEWPAMIEKRQDDLERANTAGQFVEVVNSALREFGFSHIVLYTPQFAENRATSQMVGIGIRIQIEENGVRVVRLFEGGPASNAGIQPGDLLIRADGRDVRGPGDIAGEEGTKVRIVALRDGREISFEVTRERFSTVIPEEIEWIDERTVRVHIPTFDAGYNRARVEEIMTEALKAEQLILDLRGNGGGQVINLIHLGGFFLGPEENLGTFVNRQNFDAFVRQTGNEEPTLQEIAERTRPIPAGRRDTEPFSGRISVLIDGGTGSASEIMAAALRDQRGAVLIGQRSAGAVLASLMTPIDGGFLLQYPVTDYVTPKGFRIEGNGLSPDLAAAIPRFGEEDQGVVRSLDYFKTVERIRGGASD